MDWLAVKHPHSPPPPLCATDAPRRVGQGVSDALCNAYRSQTRDLPEEMRRLLARLH